MEARLRKFFQEGQSIKEPNNPPHQLWISGQHFPNNPTTLKLHNITAVVSIGSPPYQLPSNIQHLYLEVEDDPQENIKKACERAFQFIQTHRKDGGVLVHCMLGVSRSTTILAYYLMKKHRWGLEKSLNCIRWVRPFVKPNEGFMSQLRQAQEQLGVRMGLGCF